MTELGGLTLPLINSKFRGRAPTKLPNSKPISKIESQFYSTDRAFLNQLDSALRCKPSKFNPNRLVSIIKEWDRFESDVIDHDENESEDLVQSPSTPKPQHELIVICEDEENDLNDSPGTDDPTKKNFLLPTVDLNHRKSLSPSVDVRNINHRKSFTLSATAHRKSMVPKNASERKHSLLVPEDPHVYSRRLSVNNRAIASSRKGSIIRRSSVMSKRRNSHMEHDQKNEKEAFEVKSALIRWKFALDTVRRMLRATRMFKSDMSPSDMYERFAEEMGDDSMTQQLQRINMKEEAVIISKVKSIIRTSIDQRTEEQIKVLDKVLNRLPGYLKFPKLIRPKLQQIIKLDSVNPYRTIIREGHVPQGFYILLAGECLAYQGTRKNSSLGSFSLTGTSTYLSKNGMRIINPGELFGEFSISNEEERRTYTVVTQNACEILRIDKPEYCRVIYEVQSEKMYSEQFGGGKGPDSLNSRVEFLVKIPAFRNADQEVIKNLARCCQRVKFDPGSPIIHAGRNLEQDQIYFLLSGQCRMLKILPFLRCTGTRKNAGQLVIDKQDLTTPKLLSNGYISENQLVHIGDLSPGDIFPPHYILKREILQLKASKVSTKKIKLLVDRMERLGAFHDLMYDRAEKYVDTETEISENNPRRRSTHFSSQIRHDKDNFFTMEELTASLDLTVFAIQSVECLVASRVDLLRRVGEETLKIMTETEGSLGVSVETLQKNFLAHKEWNSFKKKMFSQILEDRKRGIKDQ